MWAYDAIVQFMQNSSSAETLRGIKSGDGAELLKRLHATKGDKRSQISRWNRVLRSNTYNTMRDWPKYRATMKEAVAERNDIPSLQQNEELDDGTLFNHFYCDLKLAFPGVYNRCVADTSKYGDNKMTVESVADECETHYNDWKEGQSNARMSTMMVGQ